MTVSKKFVEAVERGDEDTARTLAPEQSSNEISLLLHRFAAQRHPSAVHMLLKLGADPTVIDDKDGTIALHHAAGNNDRASAELLVDAGSPFDVRDAEHGASPVLWAYEFGHAEVVAYLLTRGARVNLPDAAKLGLDHLVAGFLDDVPDAIDVGVGWPTPLVAATANGNVSTVRLLLDRGADPNATWRDGGTALAATKWIGDEAVRQQVIELLTAHGAGPEPA